MIDFSAPLQGMQRAEDRFNTSAQRIASSGSRGDNVDLSTEAVSMLQSRNDLAANVKVTHVADEMAKSTLNLMA